MVMIIFCLSVKEKEGLIIGSYISSGYLHILITNRNLFVDNFKVKLYVYT